MAPKAAQADLQAREEVFSAAQTALGQREDAFGQARASLDAALASSQLARETLDWQFKDAVEAQRVRMGLEDEVRRLTTLLAQATGAQEQIRREHAEVVAAKDQDLRQALERHAVQEKPMLAVVDCARQAARALETDLGKEQQRRKAEEAPAKRLAAQLDKQASLRDAARAAEADLRDQLAAREQDLAHARASAASGSAEAEALKQRIDEERKSRAATRDLLAVAVTSGA